MIWRLIDGFSLGAGSVLEGFFFGVGVAIALVVADRLIDGWERWRARR